MYYENYSYLTDRIYLMLLYKYNERKLPSFEALGRECGCTRQTVAKKLKELEENDIAILMRPRFYTFVDYLEEEDIEREEVLELLHKNYSDIQLGMILLSKIRPETYAEEVYLQLGVARSSIDNSFRNDLFISKELPPEPISGPKIYTIYGIIYESEIKYIGVTNTYGDTIQRIMDKYKLLKRENFIIFKRSRQYKGIVKVLASIIRPEYYQKTNC